MLPYKQWKKTNKREIPGCQTKFCYACRFLFLFTVVFLFVFVPLPDAELSGHAIGLILNHIRHKVWTQLHVGPSVAAHIVVVGGREQSEDLSGGDDKGFSAASRHLNVTTSVIVRYFECVCVSWCLSTPYGCGRTHNHPVCTRGSGWGAAGCVCSRSPRWRRGPSSSLHLAPRWACSHPASSGRSTAGQGSGSRSQCTTKN